MTTAIQAAPQAATENKDLMLVQGSMELIQQLPATLAQHQASVARAKQASKALIDKIGANRNRLNEILDNETKDMIVKLNKTIKTREEARKPITQIFTQISKMFTTAEGEIKELLNPLQIYRDDYAKWLHEEAERKRKEAERKAAIETAKADLKAWITEKIGLLLSDYLFKKMQQWQNAFNAISLADFDERSAKLRNLSTGFNQAKLGEILHYDLPLSRFRLLTEENITEVRAQAHTEYDFATWIAKHNLECTELKQSLVDRLGSKKAELEAEAEAERQRIAAEEAARKAEAERQAAIAKASAAEKERLEAQAKIAREQAAQKAAEAKAEQERLAKEKADREAQEQAQLAAQKAEADHKAKEAADLAAASAKAATLFDAAIEATPDAPAPETRTGFDIVVKHQAGWVEIFQLWYQTEGVKLGIEDMGKKSLNQMKTWAENHAKKTGGKINSKFLVYQNSIKAVNRK